MFELNNQERVRERKEYKDRRKIDEQQRTEAEEKREAQRKADDIRHEQQHQDDIKRMEKLEDRREEKRVADLQANQQMMMQMMQNMFQQSNLHQQSQPPNPLLSMRLSFPPVTRTSSNQATTTSISTSQSDSDADALVASIDKANLETADSTKKHKTTDDLHLEDNHPPFTQSAQTLPTYSMADTESPPPTGGQQ